MTGGGVRDDPGAARIHRDDVVKTSGELRRRVPNQLGQALHRHQRAVRRHGDPGDEPVLVAHPHHGARRDVKGRCAGCRRRRGGEGKGHGHGDDPREKSEDSGAVEDMLLICDLRSGRRRAPRVRRRTRPAPWSGRWPERARCALAARTRSSGSGAFGLVEGRGPPGCGWSRGLWVVQICCKGRCGVRVAEMKPHGSAVLSAVRGVRGRLCNRFGHRARARCPIRIRCRLAGRSLSRGLRSPDRVHAA